MEKKGEKVWDKRKKRKKEGRGIVLYIGYLAPLTNFAAQTEFSQREKDCSP